MLKLILRIRIGNNLLGTDTYKYQLFRTNLADVLSLGESISLATRSQLKISTVKSKHTCNWAFHKPLVSRWHNFDLKERKSLSQFAN